MLSSFQRHRRRSSFLTLLPILLLTAALCPILVNGRVPLSNLRHQIANASSPFPGFGPITYLPGYAWHHYPSTVKPILRYGHPLPRGTNAGYLPLYKKPQQCKIAKPLQALIIATFRCNCHVLHFSTKCW